MNFSLTKSFFYTIENDLRRSHCDEELLSSIASLSPPFPLKSGTLELPNTTDPNNLEIIPTAEPTFSDIKPS